MHKKVYNVKLYDYKHGTQIRVYNKPISRLEKDRDDLDEKSYKIEPDGQISIERSRLTLSEISSTGEARPIVQSGSDFFFFCFLTGSFIEI